MKKVFVLTLAILMLLCCGCSTATNTVTPSASVETATATPAPTAAPTPTPTPAPTPEPTAEPVGSRKSPAKIGDTIYLNISSYRGTGELSITLLEIISGDEAWDMIKEANMFNDAPGDGYQYILGKFSVTFTKDTSGDDIPLEVNDYDFAYASSDYSVEDLPSIVMPEPEFDLKLYEGATGEGWVCFKSKANEASPYAIFSDTAWFSLMS